MFLKKENSEFFLILKTTKSECSSFFFWTKLDWNWVVWLTVNGKINPLVGGSGNSETTTYLVSYDFWQRKKKLLKIEMLAGFFVEQTQGRTNIYYIFSVDCLTTYLGI